MSSYNKIFRKYLSEKQYFSRDREIGGRNKIVELDESKIGKRKYNRGQKVEGAWVIGGIERSILKNKTIAIKAVFTSYRRKKYKKYR